MEHVVTNHGPGTITVSNDRHGVCDLKPGHSMTAEVRIIRFGKERVHFTVEPPPEE